MDYMNEAKRILDKMSLTEKIGQLNLVVFEKEKEEEFLLQAAQGKIGAYLTYDRDTTSTIEHKKLMEASLKSPSGVPILFGRDVIHGHWTVFPVGLGLAASFNPELVETAFQYIAKEASANGIYWTYTPMIDIARDPRWGRIVESFGEDTYLTSRLAEASVWGLQGRDPEDSIDHDHILACPKHFLGYGAAEGGRDANTVEISMNTLLNIYYPPFLAAMKAGAGSIMSGYHDLNGEPVSASKFVLQTLVKQHGGLKGFIVSDAGTTSHLTTYRFAEDKKDAAGIAVNAGVDMDMMSYCYTEHMEALVNEGIVSEATINEAAQRIIAAKLRLDLWNRPIMTEVSSKNYKMTDTIYQTAVEAARQGSILLVNKEETLPLPKEHKEIFVTGPFSENINEMLGTWVLDGMAEFITPLSEALNNQFPDTKFVFGNSSFASQGMDFIKNPINSEYVLYFGGEYTFRTGERNSVSSLNLPAGQEEQIKTYSRLGKKVVLIIIAGRPLNLTNVLPYVSSVLYLFHPGTGGSEAIAKILSGEMEPGGRLPVTFPKTEGQLPLFYNSIQKVTDRPEHLKYIDIETKPLFSFGYGLSYTTFSLSELNVDKQTITAEETVKVSVLIKNTGKRTGEAVVQCYIQDCVSKLLRPAIELKGFQRVLLGSEEEKIVNFELGKEELGYFNQNIEWIVEPGKFKVFVGLNCEETLETEFVHVK